MTTFVVKSVAAARKKCRDSGTRPPSRGAGLQPARSAAYSARGLGDGSDSMPGQVSRLPVAPRRGTSALPFSWIYYVNHH